MPGQARKISPPPGFDPRTVQPVASPYTDRANPAQFHMVKPMKMVNTEHSAQFLTKEQVAQHHHHVLRVNEAQQQIHRLQF